MDLTGRVAVITGGAGHIGSSMAEALAELGCSVVIVDLDASHCAPARERIAQQFDVRVEAHIANLEDEDEARGIAAFVESEFGRLDILIHSAGLVGTTPLPGWVTPFDEQRADTWRRAIEVNLTAPFVVTQACSAMLRASGHGTIINVASIYGLVGPDWRLYQDAAMGSPAAYAASKGGLVQLTRWLATTLAPHVRANAIIPGGVFRNTQEPFLSRYNARVPLGRMATEDDLKGAAAYLASDLSAYVTGQMIVVDGGWTAW
jgi:NAD(P)-dependent dehydrogenase (short-subunit alcohol dehydrogenase family)